MKCSEDRHAFADDLSPARHGRQWEAKTTVVSPTFAREEID